MSLKPRAARWFELLTARDDLEPALEALAATGAIELEIHRETAAPLELSDLEARLDDYHLLAQRYHHYWPRENLRPAATPGRAAETLEQALGRLRAWSEQADPLIQRLERLEAERQELALLQEFLDAAGGRLDIGLLAQAGLSVEGRIYVLPLEARTYRIPKDMVSRELGTPRRRFLIAVGPPEAMAELSQELAAVKGRALALPKWLSGRGEQGLAPVQKRRARLDEDIDRLKAALADLNERYRLAKALGDLSRLQWFVIHAQGLPVSDNFAWITGWTSDLEGDRLGMALASAPIRGVLRFPPPPADKIPPMLLHNPRWAQPFELFARLLGVPGRDEIDPSGLLTAIVPLLFGYMFGDVGQGLVLFLAGLGLQRRWPALRLLTVCGLSAMVFGLLFGSVFSREDLLPALWLHPLDEPLMVLAVPLIGGVMIILLGLLLNAVEAHWRGRWRAWRRVDAALLITYLSLIIAMAAPAALLAAAAGLLWYLIGNILEQYGEHSPLSAAFGALGEFLEHLMQLIVNTVSFARVGAFALAHAGLSQAITGLAEAAGHPLAALLVLVLGNIIVIIIEGLVVSIQTTRLILFEFFIRFLRGEGRVFRPLLVRPPSYDLGRSQ